MRLKKWIKKSITKLKRNIRENGGENMEEVNIRKNRIALKALLMKNVKTDNNGRVLLTKDDEWRKEKEWDELYNEIKKH